MGKQWVRQEIKRNEMQDAVDKVLIWTNKNRQTASIAGGAAAAVLLAAVVFFYHMNSVKNESWSELGLAQDYAGAGRADLALQKVQTLAEKYPQSTAAGFGHLLAGDLLYPKGQYKEAIESYNKVIERGTPKALVPLALGDVALAQEGAGQCPQAIETAQKFLETYPDHYTAPQVHSCLARCLQNTGQAEPAKAAYQKIVLQYPQTAWAQWAQDRLTPPAPAPKPNIPMLMPPPKPVPPTATPATAK